MYDGGIKGLMLDSVALVKYDGDFKETLREAIKVIGGFGVLDSPIIIKPNICTDIDETGIANTNVRVVEALIRLILEEDGDIPIRIVESDSESKFADEAFEKFGYKDLAERLRSLGFNVSLINLSRPPIVKLKIDGLYFKEVELSRILTGPRYLVSVAVAKTHSLTMITGVMKNLFGLLPRKDKSFYHPHINEVIVDLNRTVKPDLCIVDAVVGLEGVVSGTPRRINRVIAGRRPVSVDATMARVMGFEPGRIRHLVEAERYGLGSLNPMVLGESLVSSTVKFNPPANLKKDALID